MRISNIKQYLGGADNVIARDIIEGDQFIFNFKIGTEPLTNYTFEIDTQLFKADVTASGSNLTINSLVAPTTNLVNNGKKAYNVHSVVISNTTTTLTLTDASQFPASGNVTVGTTSFVYTSKTDNVLTGTFNSGLANEVAYDDSTRVVELGSTNADANLLIPSTLLSNLTSENASIDSATPFIVVMSVSVINQAQLTFNSGTKRTFRLLWVVRYRPLV